MYRISTIAIFAIASMLLSATIVVAAEGHDVDCMCGSCTVILAQAGHPTSNDSPHGEGGHGLPEGHSMKIPMTCPGGCGMDGGLCMGCAPQADAVLRDLAVAFCPNCFEPDALCDDCEVGVGEAGRRMGDLNVAVAMAPEHSMAYVEGTLYGDMDALFGKLISSAVDQNLFNEKTHVGSVIPFAMKEGFYPDSVFYAGVSFPEGSQPQAPLQVVTVPSGTYMVVDHIGPHEQLIHSWLASFAYADMMGIKLGDGVAGEHYVSDPESTPAEELLTQIFIPVTGHSDGRDGADH